MFLEKAREKETGQRGDKECDLKAFGVSSFFSFFNACLRFFKSNTTFKTFQTLKTSTAIYFDCPVTSEQKCSNLF